MRVIWSAATPCRGFFDPSSQGITIVSSNLADDGVGRIVSTGFVLVVDPKSRFCDLEFNMATAQRLPKALLPRQPVMVDEAIETFVKAVESVRCFLDETSGYLSIGLTSGKPKRWYRLGPGPLTIGVEDEGRLSGIVYQGLVEDTEGKLEAAWLDELEALRE